RGGHGLRVADRESALPPPRDRPPAATGTPAFSAGDGGRAAHAGRTASPPALRTPGAHAPVKPRHHGEHLLLLPAAVVQDPPPSVRTEVAATGLVVVRERHPQGGVDALLLVDLEQLLQVPHLFVLVRHRPCRWLPGHTAQVARAPVRAGAELRYSQRL